MIPRHSFDPATQPHTKRFAWCLMFLSSFTFPNRSTNQTVKNDTSDSCALVGPPQRTTSTQANLTMMHSPRNVMCWQIKAFKESLRRVVISSPANRSVHPTMPSPTRHTYVSDRLCSLARPGDLNVCSQHVRFVCK